MPRTTTLTVTTLQGPCSCRRTGSPSLLDPARAVEAKLLKLLHLHLLPRERHQVRSTAVDASEPKLLGYVEAVEASRPKLLLLRPQRFRAVKASRLKPL